MVCKMDAQGVYADRSLCDRSVGLMPSWKFRSLAIFVIVKRTSSTCLCDYISVWDVGHSLHMSVVLLFLSAIISLAGKM